MKRIAGFTGKNKDFKKYLKSQKLQYKKDSKTNI